MMKAKFVYENIGFERKGDPLERTRIGRSSMPLNLKELYNTLTIPHSIIELNDNLLDFIIDGNYLNDDKSINYNFLLDKNGTIEGSMFSYENSPEDNLAIGFFPRKVKWNDDLDSILHDKEWIWDEPGYIIEENINFERGEVPYKSLNIGRERIQDFGSSKEAAEFFIENIEEISEGEYNKDTPFYFENNSGNIFINGDIEDVLDDWLTKVSIKGKKVDNIKIGGIYNWVRDIWMKTGIAGGLLEFKRIGNPLEVLDIGDKNRRTYEKMNIIAKELKFRELPPQKMGKSVIAHWAGPQSESVILFNDNTKSWEENPQVVSTLQKGGLKIDSAKNWLNKKHWLFIFDIS